MNFRARYNAEITGLKAIGFCVLLAAIGIYFWGDHEGFMREQLAKKLAREKALLESSHGPVLPATYEYDL